MLQRAVMTNSSVSENEKQSKFIKPLNVKIGDILYFKSYIDNEQKGIVMGDGVASNRLECLQILDPKKARQ